MEKVHLVGYQTVPEYETMEFAIRPDIQIEVDDLASLIETLKAVGTSFRNDIISGVSGLQILMDNPSGNPIELNQPSENRP